MHSTLENVPSFRAVSNLETEIEDGETKIGNYFSQVIKHGYSVEYVKFKRR